MTISIHLTEGFCILRQQKHSQPLCPYYPWLYGLILCTPLRIFSWVLKAGFLGANFFQVFKIFITFLYSSVTYLLWSAVYTEGNSRKTILSLAGKRKMCLYIYSIFKWLTLTHKSWLTLRSISHQDSYSLPHSHHHRYLP